MTEFVIIVLLLLIIIFILTTRTMVDEKMEGLSRKLDDLKAELKRIQSQPAEKIVPKPPVVEKKEVPQTPPPVPPPVVVEPVKMAENRPPIQRAPEPVKAPVPPIPKVKEKSFFESFLEKNPDIEKFIGENLINKIGIAILVLGIGFFVKYAIDQDWINEIGRTFIGVLCGGILIGLAHRMRNSFRSFSSVLVGGGLSVLYFTISIAFHEYHLMSQTLTFIVMVVITAFSVLLSISYDRKELAILAIIGGFASPFMVSTGEGNYIILFTYLLILNVGMLVLAYFKNWYVINIIAYLFTSLIFGGWLYKEMEMNGGKEPHYVGALVFATLFYLIFFGMNIINNIKENKKFIASQISMLIANTFLYYSAGMVILHNLEGGIYKGLFTALVAVFNFVFAFLLFRSQCVDITLVYLLIGLVLTFLSLAAPVQLKGNHITLFWAAEAVLLLWLSQKSQIKLIQISSLLVNG